MPKSSKKPKVMTKQSWKRFLKLRFIISFVLILLLLTVFVYIIGYQVHVRIDDNHKTRRLAQAGQDLHTLVESFKKNGLGIPMQQTRYCWRSDVEFGSGELYCEQRLIMKTRFDNEQNIISAVKFLNDNLEVSQIFKVRNEPSLSSKVSTTDTLGSLPLKEASLQNANCSLDYSIYHLDYSQVQDRGNFIIDVSCAEHMQHAIYPMMDNTSAEFFWKS